MSCHECPTKFGMLVQENICPYCDLSFCNKCMRYKKAISKSGKHFATVCKSCYMGVPRMGKDNQERYLVKGLQKSNDTTIFPTMMDKKSKGKHVGSIDMDHNMFTNNLVNLRMGRMKPISTKEQPRNRQSAVKETASNANCVFECKLQSGNSSAERQLKKFHTSSTKEGNVATRLARLRGEEYYSTVVEEKYDKYGPSFTNTNPVQIQETSYLNDADIWFESSTSSESESDYNACIYSKY